MRVNPAAGIKPGSKTPFGLGGFHWGTGSKEGILAGEAQIFKNARFSGNAPAPAARAQNFFHFVIAEFAVPRICFFCFDSASGRGR